MDLWSKRYASDEAEESLVRQVRKDGILQTYTRPTLGWDMSCELDSDKMTRQEIFDQILSRTFKSQEPEIGTAYEGLQVAVFVIAIFAIVLILLLTVLSGWKKGYNEDDGFWEVYDEYRRTAIIMTLMTTAIMILSIPFTYEVVMVMIETMEDIEFFKTSMPKLDGCID